MCACVIVISHSATTASSSSRVPRLCKILVEVVHLSDLLILLLLAFSDAIRNSRVPCFWNFGLEIHVDELPFLGCPIPVGVSIRHNLRRLHVFDLSGGVRECS